MLKWLYEIVYAFSFKRLVSKDGHKVSFWQALRFVRCDFLLQKEIKERLGIEDPRDKED